MIHTKEKHLYFYHQMLRIRRAEEAIAAEYLKQEMRCPTHLCIGQEAIAVGVSEGLKEEDVVFSNHRAHAHYLAKGGDLDQMIAEIYGKETGCTGGFGGSMHLVHKDSGFMGSAPVVGGTVPLAVGAAWAASLRGKPLVSVAYLGDGCFEEGIMHECLNFASLKRIPVLFVCENNGLSAFTGLEERQPDRAIHEVARSHGWGVWSGNGNDVLEVNHLAAQAVAGARSGKGPQFLEFKTKRWLEHCGPNNDDYLAYRTAAASPNGPLDCPLTLLKNRMLGNKQASMEDFEKIEKAAQEELTGAFKFASTSPNPSPANLSEKVYAD